MDHDVPTLGAMPTKKRTKKRGHSSDEEKRTQLESSAAEPGWFSEWK
jgi:hypothetical protein